MSKRDLASMSTTAVGKQVRTVTPARSNIFAGRQGRKLREALLAYLFLFPAFLIIGLFGLFPLLFAAYQSTLVGLNRIVGRYDGLNNYVRAIDNLTYVLFFWLAALLVFMALRSIMQARRTAQEKQWAFWIWAPSGAIIGAGFILFVLFIFRALPAVLEVPQLMRARGGPQASFQQLLAQRSPPRRSNKLCGCAALYRRRHRPALVHRAQALAFRPGSTMPPAFSPALSCCCPPPTSSGLHGPRSSVPTAKPSKRAKASTSGRRSSRSAPASLLLFVAWHYGTAPAIANPTPAQPCA